MKTTNIVNEEDRNKTYEAILHGLVARMNERILIGTFGPIRSDNEATRGYCLAMWLSESYTVKENTIMKVVEPQQMTSCFGIQSSMQSISIHLWIKVINS